MAESELKRLRAEVDKLRLGRADDQVRIANLERSLDCMWNEIQASGLGRALRQAELKERERERRYAAIRRIAVYLPMQNTAQICKDLRRWFNGFIVAPAACIADLDDLRRAYGERGPSSDTIRRALAESPSGSVKFAKFANACAKNYGDENEISYSTREA